jgi:hypothetical protein
MIESALRTRILGDAGISALIGTRIFPLILPQATSFPALTYQRISGERMHSHDGPSGLAGPRIQIDTWATSYIGAKQLADLIRQRIDGFKGTVGSDEIEGIFMDTEREFYEDGDLLKLFRVSMDFFVYYDE